MVRRNLKLNDGKTEIIVIRGNLRDFCVANSGEMSFGDTQLVSCESAKNLGVVLDSSLSFRSHIDSIVNICNFHICNLYMIKDFVNRKNLVTLVQSLIISKVDYCNSLFIGLPDVILKKVQTLTHTLQQCPHQGDHSYRGHCPNCNEDGHTAFSKLCALYRKEEEILLIMYQQGITKGKARKLLADTG